MPTNRYAKFCIIIVLLVALISPFINIPTASAAVIFDSSSSATTGSNTAQTLSWTHTASGTDRILIVGVSINTNTAVSSATYGGLPLTKIVALENGNAVRVSLWYLLNPPIGSRTVTVNMISAARFVAGAHSYAGVNQQVPFGAPITSRGNGTAAILTIPSTNNEVVVDVLARRGDLTTNSITAGGGQTVRWNTRTTVTSSTNGVTGGGSSKTGNVSATMSWSWPAIRAWAMAAISLKPVQAPDTTPPLRSNGLPSGTLPPGTTQTTLSLNTNENATCKYDISPNVTYADMTNTFSTTGNISHSQQITGLANGTSYSYYVRCADVGGNRNGDDFLISFLIDVLPPPPPDTEPPSVPQNFSATAITFSSINLSWTQSVDNVGITGYEIFRDGAFLVTVSDINNSYVDKNLFELTTYTYEILAFDAAGNESNKSNPASAMTPAAPLTPDIEPPSTPMNVQAQAISSSQIDVSWEASADNVGVAAYRIYRDGTHIASVNDISYSDIGLYGATAYSYEVSAIDAFLNESARSVPVSATTLLPPPDPDTSPPLRFNSLPAGILSSDTQNATLSFSTDENAICKYTDSSGISFDMMVNVFSTTGGTAHASQISGLLAGDEYNYYARCRDQVGNANSDDFIISFSIAPFVDNEPPTIPSNLAAIIVSPTVISFSWFPSEDNVGVAGYKVFRGDTLIATTRDDEYADTGLLESTTYAYRVSAYDAAGNESGLSTPLVIITSQYDSMPPAISNIAVSSIAESSAAISWQTDEPATSRIEYGFSALYGADIFNGDLVVSHNMLLSGLSGGAIYHFRVRSTDGSGNSAISFDQTFQTLFVPDTTPPAAINDLQIVDEGSTFVDLVWTAPGNDGVLGQATSYDIRYFVNPINEISWDAAIKLAGEPVPALSGTVQHYIVVGLSPGIKYYFAIRSADNAGNISAISNIVSVTTPKVQSARIDREGTKYSTDTIAPATPSEFQAVSTENHIILRWKNPSDADFVRVIIIRKKGSAPVSFQDGIVVYEGDREEFVDTDVVGGDVYYYSIWAYDRIPNYSQASVANVKLQAKVIQTSLPKTISTRFRFLKSLFLGMRGFDISELQKILARNKSIYQQGIISGYFGELTRNAVRKFQCFYGIVCFGDEKSTGYGLVGPKTISKLNELISKNPDFMPQKEFNLLFGVRGNAVKILQEFLAKDPDVYPEGLVTGYFGSATREAVKKFQCLYDIVCSGDEETTGYGKVGPKTAAKINELQISAER